MKVRGYAQEQYLEKATTLLERCRSADPFGGMWDVGDLHWWWRDGGYDDAKTQLFLEPVDGGEAQAMILLSHQYATFDYEVIPGLEDTADGLQAFNVGLRWLQNLRASGRHSGAVTFFVNEHHAAFRRSAESHGYEPLERAYAQLSLDAALEGAVEGSPTDALRVRSVEETDFEAGRPPVIRTVPSNFARVTQAALYRRDHHLVAVTPEGQVMAECIFWVDRINAIGTFEPVETKPEFRRRGAARALLREGVRRMCAEGVKFAKVSHYTDNLPATHLYRSLGFIHRFKRLLYGHSQP